MYIVKKYEQRETPKKLGNVWKGKKKEEYLYNAIYTTHNLKVLRHGSHSFTCKLHHACLSFVSVHQMAPPLTEELGVTHRLHLWLDGKHIVDFLLTIIELNANSHG